MVREDIQYLSQIFLNRKHINIQKVVKSKKLNCFFMN